MKSIRGFFGSGDPWPLTEFPPAERARLLATVLLAGPDFTHGLRVNPYQGVEYFNKEAFERMMSIAGPGRGRHSRRQTSSFIFIRTSLNLGSANIAGQIHSV